MSDRPRILLALTPLVERDVEAELFGATTVLDVLASAADAHELDELLRTHRADALLVSPDLSGLAGAHTAAASAAGLRVIGLALDDVGREALGTLGVDEILTLPIDEGALATAARGPAPPPAKPAAPPAAESAGGAVDDSNVVVVVGSKGAPGASECAASLAALAATRWGSMLVEVDAIGASLDVRLGADPHDGSLAGVARAVQNDEPGLRDLVDRWLVDRPGWAPTLLGAPDPVRDLARSGSAANAVRALAQLHPLLVCDVGFLISADDPDRVSSMARVHRETISVADAVVLVVGARDVQLRHGLAQLAELTEGLTVAPERLRVVVNGVGAPGSAARLEIEEALLPRLAEHRLGVDVWLPWDSRALASPRKQGIPLVSARVLHGGYRRGLEQLLDDLFLPAAPPVTRTRRHRLTAVPTSAAGTREEVALPWRR
jgi:hypothetical protein